MQELQQLRALAACGRPWVESRAQMALMLRDQFEGGGLDISEYEELMRDLVRGDRLDAEADDLETRTLLVNCVNLASKLA